jgi:hypothetical protein
MSKVTNGKKRQAEGVSAHVSKKIKVQKGAVPVGKPARLSKSGHTKLSQEDSDDLDDEEDQHLEQEFDEAVISDKIHPSRKVAQNQPQDGSNGVQNGT